MIILLAGLTTGYFLSLGIRNFLEISYTEKDLYQLYRVNVDSTRVNQELALRMVDMGGVGVRPDTLNWGSNYEHNQHFFEEVMLPYPPFIDTLAMAKERLKLGQYCGRMAEFGYNTISLPWFLEYVNFDLLPDSHRIYEEESVYRQRHQALAGAFGELMQVAADSGLGTYLWTDMVALTPPLLAYFENRFGFVDTENPALWEIYEKAAEEIFLNFPHVEGIIIRIGEAGSVYNKPGWDYSSELYVRTESSVKLMLEAFLSAAEKYDRNIIFRTWSVGVGRIGDMHTNPETYEKVLGELHSDHLIVSTKYCAGDFYSWLALNPTLFSGDHRRIIEIQAKREFEGSGAIPNYVALLHQSAIQYFMEKNPKMEGVWVWTQYGGPLRAGPMIIYPFYGFNVINDVNVFALSHLMKDPYAELDSITAEWIRGYFGSDPVLVSGLTRFLNESHGVMKSGLYISEFARYDVRALGLEPPPMLWIFEWDILGASSAVFSNIYYICRARFREVIREGDEAVEGARIMKQQLMEVKPLVTSHIDDYEQLISSVDYEIELFRLLDYYRQFFMNYYRWIDSGELQSSVSYRLAMGQFKAMMYFHELKYGGDLNTPGFDFEEVRSGIRIAENTPMSVRWARVIVVVSLFLLLLGVPGFIRERAGRRFASSLYFDAFFRPYRISRLYLYHGTGTVVVLQLLLYVLAMVVFSAFTSWLFPLCIGGLGLVYILILALWASPAGSFNKTLVTLMGPKLLIITLILVVVAVRGPFYFWYQIWVSDLFKILFFSLFIMLLFRKFHVFTVLVGKWTGRKRLVSAGMVLNVLGIQLVLAGLALKIFGLERSLTALNNELLILPGGLSKIMGITTHLGIPLELPIWILFLGSALVVISSPVYFTRDRG